MKRFRPAKKADLEAILTLMRGYYAEDGYRFAKAASRRAVMRLVLNEKLGRLWVAEDRDGVVGYLAVTFGYSLEYQGRDACIDELFIAKRARGKGLGREALALAEVYCRARGVQALHLEVEQRRKRALRMYRASGFADRERRLLTKRFSGIVARGARGMA